MMAFIDAHRAEYGVESICAQLPIAPSLRRVLEDQPYRSLLHFPGIPLRGVSSTANDRFSFSGMGQERGHDADDISDPLVEYSPRPWITVSALSGRRAAWVTE